MAITFGPLFIQSLALLSLSVTTENGKVNQSRRCLACLLFSPLPRVSAIAFSYKAFRGSKPPVSPSYLLEYGYFLISERKQQKTNHLCLSIDIQGTLHEEDRESWTSRSNKISQGSICYWTHHVSQWQLLCGGGSSMIRLTVSELKQWWELTFLPKKAHQPLSRCFPKSKNRI